MSTTLPRPPSVTFLCILLGCFSGWVFTRGIFQMNANLYDQKGLDTLLTVFVGPAVAFPCLFYMFRGHNWARIFFWVLYTPFAVWLAIYHPSRPEIERVIICAVGIAITVHPSANWYFSGRDYRKRPGSPVARRARRRSGPQRSGDYQY